MTPSRIVRMPYQPLPHRARYVGKGTSWANPFADGRDLEEAVRAYTLWIDPSARAGLMIPGEIASRISRGAYIAKIARRQLRGRDLADWTPLDLPSHVDVLLKIANEAEIA